MTWLTREEEIRLEAIKISANMCALVTAGYLSKPGEIKIAEFAPFGMVAEIESYIRTGEIPESIKPVINYRA